jgi:hypothetical protein
VTAAPADRAFAFFRRGEQREDILASWRYRLRQLTNPTTGVAFSENEIAAATSVLSRWWIQADAVDLILLANQARALLLADQIRPDRANTNFLLNYHGPKFRLTPNPASGGSGGLLVAGVPGTLFVGSTTIPDPTANFLIDENTKLKFQVLFTDTIAPSGVGLVSGSPLFVQGVDTGTATNLPAGSKLDPGNGPIAFVGPAIVAADFTGGNPPETNAQFARRIAWRERHKQGAGNGPQFRDWAEKASNAVETAFIYDCALQAGSLLVAVTQKRGDVRGPTGRIPAVGTMSAVIAKVTPPGSADVPGHVFVLAVPVVGESVDIVGRLDMTTGISSGWADLHPWPTSDSTGTPVTISALTTQQDFHISIPSDSDALPAGVTAPSLMVWDTATSRFEKLNVLSVTLVGGFVYRVQLTAAPSFTVGIGDWVCPDTALRDVIAETTETYFDSLGPGEIVDPVTGLFAARAARFPAPAEEYPQRAGSTLETDLDDALGAALADRDLPFVGIATPSIPSSPALGPNMLVAGHVGFYSL